MYGRIETTLFPKMQAKPNMSLGTEKVKTILPSKLHVRQTKTLWIFRYPQNDLQSLWSDCTDTFSPVCQFVESTLKCYVPAR